jgi:hypothetical protein
MYWEIGCGNRNVMEHDKYNELKMLEECSILRKERNESWRWRLS